MPMIFSSSIDSDFDSIINKPAGPEVETTFISTLGVQNFSILTSVKRAKITGPKN